MTAPAFTAEQQAAVARGIARANALTNIAAAEAAPGTLQAARSGGEPPPVAAPLGATKRASGVSADREAAAGPLARSGTPDALTLFDAPAARFTDPATSHQAAHTARHRAADRRRAVLLAHDAAGEHGLTGEELATATGEDYSVIGPRRPALVAAGWLAPTGQQRTNSRGNAMDVFAITAAGRMEAARMAVAA